MLRRAALRGLISLPFPALKLTPCSPSPPILAVTLFLPLSSRLVTGRVTLSMSTLRFRSERESDLRDPGERAARKDMIFGRGL